MKKRKLTMRWTKEELFKALQDLANRYEALRVENAQLKAKLKEVRAQVPPKVRLKTAKIIDAEVKTFGISQSTVVIHFEIMGKDETRPISKRTLFTHSKDGTAPGSLIFTVWNAASQLGVRVDTSPITEATTDAELLIQTQRALKLIQDKPLNCTVGQYGLEVERPPRYQELI